MLTATFDTPRGEIFVSASWDQTNWCIERATDADGREVDLTQHEEFRAYDALENEYEKEMAA